MATRVRICLIVELFLILMVTPASPSQYSAGSAQSISELDDSHGRHAKLNLCMCGTVMYVRHSHTGPVLAHPTPIHVGQCQRFASPFKMIICWEYTSSFFALSSHAQTTSISACWYGLWSYCLLASRASPPLIIP
jgi:hypothetical protein